MNATAILRSIMTSTSRYEERADGVIVQRLLTTRTQTLADARENLAALVRMTVNSPRRVLIDIRILRGMQIDARDYYAEPTHLCSAVAFLVASPGSRQISQHWMAVNRHLLPLAQFADEAEAIVWLNRCAGEQTKFSDEFRGASASEL